MSWLRAKPRERSANIFINYRREDSAGHAGRLFDALSSHFSGRLFMDVDTLKPGVDFFEAIEQAVGSCEALIVIIGREWLTIKDKTGRRRLDAPGDFVRLEVESALTRRIRVIPVLVQDASMPGVDELPASLARLARHNAIELSDVRWAYDVDRLTHTIQEILEETSSPPPVAGSRVRLLSLAALVLVAAVVLGSLVWIRRTPGVNGDPSHVQRPPGLAAVTVPAGGVAAGPPAKGEPAAHPAGDVNGDSVTPDVPHDAKPGHSVAPPIIKRAAVEVPRTPARLPPASTPIPRAEAATIQPTAVAPPDAVSAPAASLQPARATILSPRNGETVGSDVMVQGTVSGLGDQQVFLGIRQQNGAIYPRGELFPNADGQWSIKLRSSKEKTFEILVVTSTRKEATQVLRDQRSRDDGLSVLPGGASISSGVVMLKKQGRFGSFLNPKAAEPDR